MTGERETAERRKVRVRVRAGCVFQEAPGGPVHSEGTILELAPADVVLNRQWVELVEIPELRQAALARDRQVRGAASGVIEK